MRVMAIDYGDARTGIAVSDQMGTLVGKTAVIHCRGGEKTAEEICRLLRENGAERLIVGLPKNMDGSEGPRASICREFAALLEEKRACRSASGMSAERRWKPIRFCRTAIIAERNGKTPSTRWRHL